MAGDDTKALERLARFKTPADVWNSYREAETKLREKPSLMTSLPEGATEDQIKEYREAKGVPETGSLDGYGIKAPDGYEISEGEKELLDGIVSDLHAKHYGKAEVNDMLDHYFRVQHATLQQKRQTAAELQSEWQANLRKDLGRDYDATIASAEAYLNNLFGDDQDAKTALLSAQLPGGGYLGDYPQFIRMTADLALQNGFTDRIEANALESGGKSLAEQQREIEGLLTSDPAKYNDPQTQARYEKIIGLRMDRGELDDLGNEKRRR